MGHRLDSSWKLPLTVSIGCASVGSPNSGRGNNHSVLFARSDELSPAVRKRRASARRGRAATGVDARRPAAAGSARRARAAGGSRAAAGSRAAGGSRAAAPARAAGGAPAACGVRTARVGDAAAGVDGIRVERPTVTRSERHHRDEESASVRGERLHGEAFTMPERGEAAWQSRGRHRNTDVP